MVKANPDGQQPMPASPDPDEPEKKNHFGESKAQEKPRDGKTKYDVPAAAEDDFAIDEQRAKPIRGNEAPKD
ncbi:hypothetical protein [Jannaschia sp. 2305UL9-9]|uniref:hypothetical protein n=1 Tax=Jannaschia sp. 2305UL9-9 TaxID=3121638 RepID=UPI003528AF45